VKLLEFIKDLFKSCVEIASIYFILICLLGIVAIMYGLSGG